VTRIGIIHCASSLRRALSGQTAVRSIGLGKVGLPIDLAAVCPDKDLREELAQCVMHTHTHTHTHTRGVNSQPERGGM